MKDLFGKEGVPNKIHLNIYADEIQSRVCPISNNEWHYIGLIFEDLANPLLEDIITARFKNNFDKESLYFDKNNRIVHWSEISSTDQKNICKRWFEYILEPNRSRKTLYSYILGLNDSNLIKEEFNSEDEFNSKYNRFFRSAILYALKTFFPNRNIIIENVFHEEGQQKDNLYFPWHSIYKLREEKHINFACKEVTFLPKDHKSDKRSNLIQLCDCLLGVSTSILHGIRKSNTSKYREELADLYFPLFRRLIEQPNNKSSRYEYHRRIMIRFFPKTRSNLGDQERMKNQFYNRRVLYYSEQKSGQQRLVF